MHESFTDPSEEPTDRGENGNAARPARTDLIGRIARLERQQDKTHEEYVAILKAIGGVHSMVEKDQVERRTAKWMQAPVWLGVLAWIAIAAVEVYSRIKVMP
jgi:hypothetical protein